MTTNQIIAFLFPVVGTAAIALTGLLIAKPWARKKRIVAAEVAVSVPQADNRREAEEVVRKIEQLSDQLQTLAHGLSRLPTKAR